MTGGTKIAVLGAGAWGTALAASFRRAGPRLRCCGAATPRPSGRSTRHRNPRYLGDIALPEDLRRPRISARRFPAPP
jgi:glycerol-3-phosphate dehydrogenase (NAD(P)+)